MMSRIMEEFLEHAVKANYADYIVLLELAVVTWYGIAWHGMVLASRPR